MATLQLFIFWLILVIVIFTISWTFHFLRRLWYRKKFGDFTESFEGNCNKWGYHALVLVNESKNRILLNDEIWDIDDIKGFEHYDLDECSIASGTRTVTSTGSMVGRAAVGGMVGGGVGALLGGLTASKKEETVYNRYEESHEIWIKSYKLGASGRWEASCRIKTYNAKETADLVKFLRAVKEKHVRRTPEPQEVSTYRPPTYVYIDLYEELDKLRLCLKHGLLSEEEHKKRKKLC